MKHLVNILFFGLLSMRILAQQTTTERVLSLTEDQQPIYKPQILSGKHLYLKMAYGSPVILNPSEAAELKGATIASIDIVYSYHLKGSNFPTLTKKRLDNLEKINPALFKDARIKWRRVRQLSCTDRASAEKLFHGIVITYRPLQSKEEMEKEKTYLKEILSWASKAPVTLDERALSAKVKTPLGFKRVEERMGSYFSSTVIADSIGVSRDISLPGWSQDSAVTKVLNRNNWTNMIIAADLTGSMSPYSAQLLMWFKLNTINEKVKQFVFFNDGDMKFDHQKVIGSTGGIYAARAATYEDVEALAFKTMTNGNGGDGPENDVEALIKAMELCPECNDIVLIADNWAPIKDISLQAKIKKPVKIILCGSDYGVNVEYLNFARATGGSVHTMTEDITELVKMNEGQQLTIGKQLFKIENGKFVELTKMGTHSTSVTAY